MTHMVKLIFKAYKKNCNERYQNLSEDEKKKKKKRKDKRTKMFGSPHPTDPKPTLKNTLILRLKSGIYHA